MLRLVLHYGLKKCTLSIMELYCCYESQSCFFLILAERLAVPTSSEGITFNVLSTFLGFIFVPFLAPLKPPIVVSVSTPTSVVDSVPVLLNWEGFLSSVGSWVFLVILRLVFSFPLRNVTDRLFVISFFVLFRLRNNKTTW